MIRALLITALLSACGAVETGDRAPEVDTANLPPAGDIWFGETFDTSTFEVSGRTDTVSASETFVFVGNLDEVVEGDELMVRTLLDGAEVATQNANLDDTGDAFGFTYGPLGAPGAWTIQLVDVGGNVLASGDVEATE